MIAQLRALSCMDCAHPSRGQYLWWLAPPGPWRGAEAIYVCGCFGGGRLAYPYMLILSYEKTGECWSRVYNKLNTARGRGPCAWPIDECMIQEKRSACSYSLGDPAVVSALTMWRCLCGAAMGGALAASARNFSSADSAGQSPSFLRFWRTPVRVGRSECAFPRSSRCGIY